MALSSTIFKAALQVADMDRNHYADYQLTLARHPSETDERMMVRLLAFALHADARLLFTKGLCADDEPELWQHSYSNELELWIDVGLPDERRIRKACSRARQVVIYSYGGRGADIWWQKNAAVLERFENLRVIDIPAAASQELASLAQRSMQLSTTIQDGQIWLSSSQQSCHIIPLSRK